jgi:hypothetical protein
LFCKKIAEPNGGAVVCDKLHSQRSLLAKLGHHQQFARTGVLRRLFSTNEWQENTDLGLDNSSYRGFIGVGNYRKCSLLCVWSTETPT